MGSQSATAILAAAGSRHAGGASTPRPRGIEDAAACLSRAPPRVEGCLTAPFFS
jgi:hypothetical protein